MDPFSLLITLLLMAAITLEVGQLAEYTRTRSDAVKVIMLVIIGLLIVFTDFLKFL